MDFGQWMVLTVFVSLLVVAVAANQKQQAVANIAAVVFVLASLAAYAVAAGVHLSIR